MAHSQIQCVAFFISFFSLFSSRSLLLGFQTHFSGLVDLVRLHDYMRQFLLFSWVAMFFHITTFSIQKKRREGYQLAWLPKLPSFLRSSKFPVVSSSVIYGGSYSLFSTFYFVLFHLAMRDSHMCVCACVSYRIVSYIRMCINIILTFFLLHFCIIFKNFIEFKPIRGKKSGFSQLNFYPFSGKCLSVGYDQ